MLAAAAALFAAIAADARAQVNLPFGPANYEHDFQLFAPVELDLDNEPYVDDHGYTFEYNKLSWSYSGERYEVGDPDVVVQAERIYLLRGQDEGPSDPTAQDILQNSYIVNNGLQDISPDAGFAWGDRYEFGYRDRGHGWTIGILDGPKLHQTQIHGMGDPLDGGLDPPFIDLDYTDSSDVPGVSGTVAAPGDRAFGFGNVHVNFSTPPGFLYGFRDYLNFLGEGTTGTQGGPILYVGNYGRVDEDDDIDDGAITIVFFRLADDLDGDLIPASGFLVDPVTGAITQFHDFDDLHQFNVAFTSVTVRNTTSTRGIEAMWSHQLTNRHYQAKNQNNHLELFYGARFLRLYDSFEFVGLGSILGRTAIATSMTNQIVGPQVGLKWVNQRQRWRLSADTRFMFGYNVQDWDMVAGVGEELIPGALNRPLFAQPTWVARGLQQEDFSPVGELRLQTSYYLTQSVALNLGYTGMFVGNIRRAAPTVQYSLPEPGYREAGTQDLIVNGVDMGIEIVY